LRFHPPKSHLSPKEWQVGETERYARAERRWRTAGSRELDPTPSGDRRRESAHGPALLDLLTNATACFGQYELVARNCDRAVALDPRGERRDGLLADVGKHNDAGLAQVTFARSALAQMGKEITAAKLSKKFVRLRLQECADEL